MGPEILAGAVWLGLVLLGAWGWARSRRDGQKIGESIGTLFLGLWLPATFVAYGLYAILAARTWLFDRLFRLVEIGGGAAVSLGVAWISVGLCCHFVVTWRQHRSLSAYADMAAFIAAMVAVCAAFVAFWVVL